MASAVALSALPVALVPSTESFMSAFDDALEAVDRFQAQVSKGQVISGFGAKAQKVVEKAAGSVGDVGQELEQALDGVLHSLFLQQLDVLREQVFERFRHPGKRATELTLERADRVFSAKAKELVRPGSDWSYETEQGALRTSLDSELRQASSVLQERERVAQTQRATADVISKLQKQMEQMGEKVRGTSAGSSWVIWTSYRLPGTPFQMSARYQEGRTNIELNLSPNKDPANAEAGMVEGLTASNLGLKFNIGV